MKPWGVLGLVLVSCSVPPTPEPHYVRVPVALPVPVPVPVPLPDPGSGSAPADRIELTFAGDILFGGTFRGHFHDGHIPENDPLAAVDPLLRSDLALANLETTVVDHIPEDDLELAGDLYFAATPAQVALLPEHGITAVTIANNHANDMGRTGVIETPRHLAELGITAFGSAGHGIRVEEIEVKGWRIAVIAATVPLNHHQEHGDPRIPQLRHHLLTKTIVPLVKAARADHDLVLVVLHWGIQFADAPEHEQVRAAHAFIDAGADAVIGSHPHVIQGIERYKGGLIAYSLGNFVFREGRGPPRLTGVLRLGFERPGRCLDAVSFAPAVMSMHGTHHPEPATGHGFRDVAKRVIDMSRLTGTPWRVEGDRLVTDGACVIHPPDR